MKVTFDNIEHIHKLLTTTEWIDKYNPHKRLEKLEQDLKEAKDEKTKEKITRAISGVQKSINSSKAGELTLEKAEINKNEAEILLTNLHLVYENSPSYNKQSQEVLKKLIQDNFDKINSSEIYDNVTKKYIPTHQSSSSSDIINQDLYDKVLPYCDLIANLYTERNTLDKYDMAKKLSTYFSNFEDVQNYLKTVDYSTKGTIELSFQYNLPGELEDKSLEFWQNLNAYVPKLGREPLVLFSNAHLLEDDTKFKELLNNEEVQNLFSKETRQEFFASGVKPTEKQQKIKQDLNELVTKVNKLVIKKCYKYNKDELSENIKPLIKELTDVALKVKLDEESFQKALNFTKEGKLKADDNMPDINFEFKVNGKNYHFSKLPPTDMRGFVLGKLSNSCQSVGGHSEKCVLDGMSKANAGFYIITDDTGKIRAQSYGWLGEEAERANSLVLDSFEYLPGEKKLFIPAMNKLREELQQHELKLYVGSGGQTPKLNVSSQTRPEPVEKGLYMYGDSANVYNIQSELSVSPVNDLSSQKELKEFDSFQSFEDNHKMIQKNIFTSFNGELNLNQATLLNIEMTAKQLYEMSEEKQKFFIDRSNLIKGMQDEDISGAELFAIPIEKLEFFIESETALKLLELRAVGLSITALSKMPDEKQEFFIEHNNNIKELNALGLSVDQLLKIPDEKQEFFIEHSDNIKNLYTRYKKIAPSSISELLEMTIEKQEFFIKNAYQIQELDKAGLPVDQLLAMPYEKVEKIVTDYKIEDFLQEKVLTPEDLQKCSLKQLEDLLDKKITPEIFKASAQAQKALSKAKDHITHSTNTGISSTPSRKSSINEIRRG